MKKGTLKDVGLFFVWIGGILMVIVLIKCVFEPISEYLEYPARYNSHKKVWQCKDTIPPVKLGKTWYCWEFE